MSPSKKRSTKNPSKHKSGGSDRIDRINDVMHRLIARVLHDEFKDPRIGMVTVSNVDVSRDLSHAKVYVTVFEEEKIKETLEILNGAAGFFRGEISHGVHLRSVPKIRFYFDDSVLKGSRIESLLAGDHPHSTDEEANE